MIHIACNIDHNYVRYCGVTLVSLFESNRGEEFTAHIMARGLDDADRDVLRSLARRYGHTVLFHEPDGHLLDGFTIRATHGRLSTAAYYRCFLPDILPADVDRVLYLDCDIVVRGSIAPLWATPLDTRTAVAAVEDMGCGEVARYDRLHYPQADSYFNSGVLLVNLAYWREHGVAQACMDYYRRYPERIVFNDQDLLNCVLHDRKRLLDVKWNVQDGFYRTSVGDAWRKEHAEALRHPVVLHFTNRKPWSYDSQHPLRAEFFKYWALTPWSGERPWATLPARLKRFFRLLPFCIGARKPKYIRMDALP